MNLSNNLSYLMKLSRLKQKEIADQLDVGESAISRWKSGKPISKTSLKKIAKFFSRELNIPLDLFEDGKALLEKDFEKLLSESSYKSESNLQHTELPAGNLPKIIGEMGENKSREQDLFSHERALPHYLRKVNGGLPVPEASIGYLIEIFKLSDGSNVILKNLVGILEDLRDLKNDQDKANQG